MKHLKTFESFNIEQSYKLDEGFMDAIKKAKKLFAIKPDVNITKKRIITKAINGLNEDEVKFMSIGKDGEKTKFNKEGFLKMVEEVDNFNGTYTISKDLVYYTPAEWSGSSGGFKTTGGFGG